MDYIPLRVGSFEVFDALSKAPLTLRQLQDRFPDWPYKFLMSYIGTLVLNGIVRRSCTGYEVLAPIPPQLRRRRLPNHIEEAPRKLSLRERARLP